MVAEKKEQDVMDLDDRLRWMRDGEAFFLASLEDVTDGDLDAPSLLGGWTRAHVVSHVARNADALQNLLAWAETGVETPMYSTPEQRNADIAAGADRPPSDVRDDAITTSRQLVAATEALADAAWAAEVRTARGRLVPASEIPWMRCREVWIHGIDLGSSRSFPDLPPGVVDALLDEVTQGFAARDDCPPIVITLTDRGERLRIGGTGDPVEVEGTAPAALGWLLGRTAGQEMTTVGAPPLPDIPAWL